MAFHIFDPTHLLFQVDFFCCFYEADQVRELFRQFEPKQFKALGVEEGPLFSHTKKSYASLNPVLQICSEVRLFGRVARSEVSLLQCEPVKKMV